MATLHVDPAVLRQRYDSLLAEAEKIKRVLDILPELESLASNGKSHTSPRDSGLRPVNAQLLESIGKFVEQLTVDRFLIPDAMKWLAKHHRDFDPDKDRDAVVAGLKHFVGDGQPLTVLVPGVGRRPQVYGVKERLPKDIGGEL